MLFDPEQMSVRDIYLHMVRLITPRPIAWVSTCSQAGKHNLAPFSFFNGVGANPPTVVFSPVNRRDGSKKDTLLNVEETGEFVVNIVSYSQAEQMNQTSADYDSEINEFEAVGFNSVGIRKNKTPKSRPSAGAP